MLKGILGMTLTQPWFLAKGEMCGHNVLQGAIPTIFTLFCSNPAITMQHIIDRPPGTGIISHLVVNASR